MNWVYFIFPQKIKVSTRIYFNNCYWKQLLIFLEYEYLNIRQPKCLYSIITTWVYWKIMKFCSLEPFFFSYSQNNNSTHITGIPSYQSPTFSHPRLLYTRLQLFIIGHHRTHLLKKVVRYAQNFAPVPFHKFMNLKPKKESHKGQLQIYSCHLSMNVRAACFHINIWQWHYAYSLNLTWDRKYGDASRGARNQ